MCAYVNLMPSNLIDPGIGVVLLAGGCLVEEGADEEADLDGGGENRGSDESGTYAIQ